MNGIPATVDLNPLIGKIVLQICFGVLQLMVKLDDSIEIGIECECSYIDNLGVSTLILDYSAHASLICNLLGLRISSVKRTQDGGLMLRFETGVQLNLANSNREYESFQIHLPSGIYVA